MTRVKSIILNLAAALLIAAVCLGLGEPVLPSSAAGDTTPPRLLVLAPPGWNPQGPLPVNCLPASFYAIAADDSPAPGVSAHIHGSLVDAGSDFTLVSHPTSDQSRRGLLALPVVQAAVGNGYWDMIELVVNMASSPSPQGTRINTSTPVSISFYAQDTAGNRSAVEFPSVSFAGVTGCRTFSDVALSDAASVYVNYMATMGIVHGTSGSSFSPTANLSRLDTAIFLARAANPGYAVPAGQSPQDASCAFADVTPGIGTEAYNAITWDCNTSTMLGMGQGYSPSVGTTNYFRTSNTVTRADAAIFFSRLPAPILTSGIAPLRSLSFTDVPSSDPTLYDAMSRTYGLGMLDGYNLNQYQPANTLLRIQMAKLMYRVMSQPFYSEGS